MRFRIWPDGTIQECDEPAYSWMSDDYDIFVADTEEEAIEEFLALKKIRIHDDVKNGERTAIMVDPPAGSRYGFPCELPNDKPYEELLREHNYPISMFSLALKHSRFWEEKRNE